MISHAITFLDNMAVRVPTLDAWDQFVWLPSVAMPCIPQEADCIAELGAHHLMGWPDDSSLEEEDDEQMEEEDGEPEDDEPEGDEHEEAEGWGEADPESPSSGAVLERGKTELEVEPRG